MDRLYRTITDVVFENQPITLEQRQSLEPMVKRTITTGVGMGMQIATTVAVDEANALRAQVKLALEAGRNDLASTYSMLADVADKIAAAINAANHAMPIKETP